MLLVPGPKLSSYALSLPPPLPCYCQSFADPERAFGRESRSLIAAYDLIQGGWDVRNIIHMEGGVQEWRFRDLPMEGSLWETWDA